MKLEAIKYYAEQKKIPIRKMAEMIGMSEGNLHRCIRTNKIQAHDLERISLALEVPITAFFDSPSFIDPDSQYLKPIDIGALLREKDARIKDLKERIDNLVNYLAKLSDGFVNH